MTMKGKKSRISAGWCSMYRPKCFRHHTNALSHFEACRTPLHGQYTLRFRDMPRALELAHTQLPQDFNHLQSISPYFSCVYSINSKPELTQGSARGPIMLVPNLLVMCYIFGVLRLNQSNDPPGQQMEIVVYVLKSNSIPFFAV